MAKYGIKITYSNGDEEDGLYGNFASKEEAFKEICVLAVKEAYVQNEDFDELKTCSVYFDAYEYKADLHYNVDDTWCYDRVQEVFTYVICNVPRILEVFVYADSIPLFG